MTSPTRAALLLVAALAIPSASAAQDGNSSRFSGSLALLNTQPLGELATGPGIGVAASAAWAVHAARIFRIRGEFRGALYDWENREVCFSRTVGCRVRLDLNTSYGVVYAGLGPEIALPLGFADLALAATGGWGAFLTSSSLQGVDEYDESIGNTTNYEDHAFAWSAGGELRVPITHSVAVALGTHYQHNGRMSYLVQGGIVDNPDGSLTLFPITSDANLLAITLGVAIRPVIGR